MSEQQKVDQNGTGAYKVKYWVRGCIVTLPRVVSINHPGKAQESHPFELQYVGFFNVKDGRLAGTEARSGIFSEVRDSFNEGVYTDPDGVIRPFTPPVNPWQIRIDDVNWVLLEKLADIEETPALEAPNGNN